MSIVHSVMNVMRLLKSATVDDVHPRLPQYSRRQVLNAMQNARCYGWLTCEGHKPRKSATPAKGKRSTGVGRGSVPSTYHFVKMPPTPQRDERRYARPYVMRPMVSSVFELGRIQ